MGVYPNLNIKKAATWTTSWEIMKMKKSYLGLMIVYPDQLKGGLKYLKTTIFLDISVNS